MVYGRRQYGGAQYGRLAGDIIEETYFESIGVSEEFFLGFRPVETVGVSARESEKSIVLTRSESLTTDSDADRIFTGSRQIDESLNISDEKFLRFETDLRESTVISEDSKFELKKGLEEVVGLSDQALLGNFVTVSETFEIFSRADTFRVFVREFSENLILSEAEFVRGDNLIRIRNVEAFESIMLDDSYRLVAERDVQAPGFEQEIIELYGLKPDFREIGMEVDIFHDRD